MCCWNKWLIQQECRWQVSWAAVFCSASQLNNPVMLENTANIFSDGLQRRPLLTSQENSGWDHKCILSTASGCMTCLYRQWKAYSGLRIPHVNKILGSPKSNEDRFDRKIDLFKPRICTTCKENIHCILFRWKIYTVRKMGRLLWENKSVPTINLQATGELNTLTIRQKMFSLCI